MKKSIFFLMILPLAAMVSCGDKDKDKNYPENLIGTWQLERACFEEYEIHESGGYSSTPGADLSFEGNIFLTFNKNGSYEQAQDGETTTKGTWKFRRGIELVSGFSGDAIDLVRNDTGEKVEMELDYGSLILDDELILRRFVSRTGNIMIKEAYVYQKVIQ